jgi:epoxyqueuosine reductase
MATGAGAAIVEKARELGAAAAGIADLELLKRSPSHHLLARFGTKIDGEYAYDEDLDRRHVDWPADARSALVIAVAHPREKPELDWSSPSGNTPGNRLLMDIAAQVSVWAEESLSARAWPQSYWVEEGGVFMKDAAVFAGLGCIGRNNLLVHPDHGPRLRLRVVLLDAELTPTGPIPFDPCDGCDEPCRRACPQGAFERVVLTPADAGIDELPGRDGSFSRSRSFVQMEIDAEESGVERDEGFLSDLTPARPEADGVGETEGRVKWCRACELACPVGEVM